VGQGERSRAQRTTAANDADVTDYHAGCEATLLTVPNAESEMQVAKPHTRTTGRPLNDLRILFTFI
jgi:hypothetical protein